MSRIDEALRRANTPSAEDPPPPLPEIAAAGNVEFAAEAEEPCTGVEAALTLDGVAPADANAGVVEFDGDVSKLPGAEKLVSGAHNSISVEQFRRLAARVLLAQAESGARVLMVTSAVPGEGKTLTSANLALTLSESYKRQVLLIDGDLRRPWIHQVFQIPNVSGLNDGLRMESERKIPLVSYTEHLSILTAGRPDADPMSVLSGIGMRRVLEEASQRFEFVIIDTPPVGLLSDAHLLSGLVDAVLLVVESGKSPLPALKRAVEAVGRARVLGVVLNRADGGLPEGGYDYYHKYRVGKA